MCGRNKILLALAFGMIFYLKQYIHYVRLGNKKIYINNVTLIH